MSNFDPSRLSDLKLIDDKLHDYKTTRWGKRRLERSKAAIQQQERDPYVRSLRSRLLKATQAGDTQVVTQINEQLHKYDIDHGHDRRES